MNNRLRYFPTTLIFIVVVCASACVVYSQQQSAEKSPGSISGRLTSAQKPLSGIVVQLIGPPRPGQYKKTQVAQVVTDDGGNYNFRSIAPGTYDIVPVTGAYVISDMTQNYQPGKTVTIASGENASNINFELGLAATIRGQIKDADGRPVASQLIELLIVEKGSQSHFPARGITVKPSDAQGNYSIDNVPPGRYLLSTERPDSASTRGRPGATKRVIYPLTYYPSATDQRSAKVIEVAPGAALIELDITVTQPLNTYQIAGRVIDEKTGAPISKVGFKMEFRGTDGSRFNLGTAGWNSDADGQFNIPMVLSGHFVIQPVDNAGSNVYGDPVEFDIIDKDMTGLEVKMHHAAALSGKVIIDGAAAATDMEKFLKLKFSLMAYPLDTRSPELWQGKVDADGQFQIAGLRPGRVKVRLSPGVPGGLNEFSILKIKRDDQDLPEGIEIGNGEDLTGLQVIVKAAGSASGTIRGQVKVEGGELEGVNLYVDYRRVDGDQNQYSAAMLDTRGLFVIEKLPAGEYEFMIGPMSLTVSNETGSKTMQRMPTVKQTAKVTAGTESEVILTMKLRPQ